MTEVNQKERAARAWPILVDVALNNRLITYGELARQLDIHHRAVRYVLSEIQDYCLLEKLPPITILVVDQKDGRPGAGFIAWDVNDLEHGLALVYEFPWAAQENPFGFASDGATIQSIADAIVKREFSAGLAVKDRVSSQVGHFTDEGCNQPCMDASRLTGLVHHGWR